MEKGSARNFAGLFPVQLKQSSPKGLWIGCEDNRVPEGVVLPLKPGDLFIHWNLANYGPRCHLC